MKVVGSLNIKAIKSKYSGAKEKAQKELSNVVLNDSNMFIPMDTGTLRNSGRIEEDNTSVEWQTPYANRLYHGDNFEFSKKNPNAKPRWFEHAKGLNIKNWVALVKKIMGESNG